MRLLALRSALRTIGMLFNHCGGYRRVARWDNRADRLLAGRLNAAMLEELDEDDLRQLLKRMAIFNDPRAIDVVRLIGGET